MRISRSATLVLPLLVAAALVAACNAGGSQSPGLAPSSGLNGSGSHVAVPQDQDHQPGSTFVGVKWAGNVHPDRHKSWMSPDAKDVRRLYFASDDGTDDVYVFALPSMTLTGTLTGFHEPQGECTDRHGNVYIANTSALEVLEYSRTGTLLNTYNDSYGYPVGCAVNPVNGDLAVTDKYSTSFSAGQVLVYSSPSSSPTVLTNPAQYQYFFAGYDNAGDLWVDGLTYSSGGPFILSSCGASSCSTINLSGGTIYFPGAVQWDRTRSEWVVFDQSCGDTPAACSYPVSGTGVLGSPTTYLNYEGGPVCDLVQAVIAANGKKYAAGGDYEFHGYGCSSTSGAPNSSFDRWAYSSGGTPTNYTTSYANVPSGAAVSTK